MAKAPKKAAKKAVKKAPKYKVEVEVNEETFKLEGDTLLEALKGFEFPPIQKTKMVVRAKGDKKEVEFIKQIHETRRMASNGTALELLAINLERRLGSGS